MKAGENPMSQINKDAIPSSIPNNIAIELYRKMLGVFFIEERLKIFTRQGKISFHASTRGHEKVQIGTVMLMNQSWTGSLPTTVKSDCLCSGNARERYFLHMLSREGDPSSNGRNMPEHFSSLD
jgi:TPP-dependent pyruvate/acetoin dehydrogenase alpha subunit